MNGWIQVGFTHPTKDECQVLRACGRVTTGPARAGGRPRACRRRSRRAPAGCAGARSRGAPARRSSPDAAGSLSAIRPGGKSSGVRIGPSPRITARSRALSSSRTFPFQGAAIRPRIVALSTPSTRLPSRPAVRGQEGRDQLGDILAAVAQGGQVDRDDVEAVIQVGAKPTGGDLGRQVLVRRRRPPGPGTATGRVAADGQDLLVLDGAEQLRLGRQRHLADLVEEDRPRAGGHEQPGVVAVGAGEGPPDVAEKLVLQQVVRDRRAR